MRMEYMLHTMPVLYEWGAERTSPSDEKETGDAGAAHGYGAAQDDAHNKGAAQCQEGVSTRGKQWMLDRLPISPGLP